MVLTLAMTTTMANRITVPKVGDEGGDRNRHGDRYAHVNTSCGMQRWWKWLEGQNNRIDDDRADPCQ